MQRELWTVVAHLGLSVTEYANGTLCFQAEDWGAINTEAHKLREKKFGEWYFMTLKPEAFLTRFIQHLRANSLPYEVEFHGSRLALLLPRCDERKHKEIHLV